jgi:Secretion system C-terminal sorting domain
VPLKVTIRDINGKNIFKKEVQGGFEYLIDLSNTPQGVYNIILKDDEQPRIHKLVIIS